MKPEEQTDDIMKPAKELPPDVQLYNSVQDKLKQEYMQKMKLKKAVKQQQKESQKEA